MLLRITLSLLLLATLAGCGQAGPLYRPDNTEPQPTTPEAQ